jgi:hypothetical protein
MPISTNGNDECGLVDAPLLEYRIVLYSIFDVGEYVLKIIFCDSLLAPTLLLMKDSSVTLIYVIQQKVMGRYFFLIQGPFVWKEGALTLRFGSSST